jgi:hypothetical protein
VFVTPVCELVFACVLAVILCPVPYCVCKRSARATVNVWVYVRDNVDLLSLCLFRNACCQLRSSCLDTPTRRYSSDNDFDALLCQRICDTAPILYTRQILSCKAQLAEAQQAMCKNDRILGRLFEPSAKQQPTTYMEHTVFLADHGIFILDLSA